MKNARGRWSPVVDVVSGAEQPANPNPNPNPNPTPDPGPGVPQASENRPPFFKTLRVASAGLVGAMLSTFTPKPSAMLIRSVFEEGARATIAEMEPFVPDAPLDEKLGLSYAAGGEGSDGSPSTTLDVFRPAGVAEPLPTVVWIHGGAWISGGKEDVAPYLRILASHGYTTVGLNYTISPEAIYPVAITELNDALRYLNAHAAELGIDPSRIVLAGDSAGAQLASQLATLTSNAEYAHLLGLTPALRPEQLVGTILNCGVYDLGAMADLTGIEAWGFKIALWGYTGTKKWSATYAGTTMSSIRFANAAFPPTFISGGNGDALTWIQSVPMANALKQNGVDVTELFWPASHEPALPHEYQFHLRLDEAQHALTETLAFLAARTGQ